MSSYRQAITPAQGYVRWKVAALARRGRSGVGPDPGRARLWLRPDAAGVAGDFARREATCCGFLDLELVPHGDGLRVDVTSPAPEAAVVIARLSGIEAECPPAADW
jgi:hypothetical protein